MQRRNFITGAAAIPFVPLISKAEGYVPSNKKIQTEGELQAALDRFVKFLNREFNGRMGGYASRTANGNPYIIFTLIGPKAEGEPMKGGVVDYQEAYDMYTKHVLKHSDKSKNLVWRALPRVEHRDDPLGQERIYIYSRLVFE